MPEGVSDRDPDLILRVVTIDGPAGSGKSTTAREVARRIGFRHLDSGALYRALTLALLRRGIDQDRWTNVTADVLSGLDVRLEPGPTGFQVVLDGVGADAELRSGQVTRLVPFVAQIGAVRDRLLHLQRSAAAFGGLVADGRDMGTVVFPDAALKVFLTASLEERARRRLVQEGKPSDAEAVRREADRIRARDDVDAGRERAPLVQAPDALVVDTTDTSFDEQVSRIVEAIRGDDRLRA